MVYGEVFGYEWNDLGFEVMLNNEEMYDFNDLNIFNNYSIYYLYYL